MERQGFDGSPRQLDNLALAWKKFPLAEAMEQSFDSDTSSSHYELQKLLVKTITNDNMAIFSQNQKLKNDYFHFIDQIHQSGDSYYLSSVLELSFENAKGQTKDFAMETFNKVFSIMGFNDGEIALLLEKWSEGMHEGGNDQFEVAKNGVDHHMMSIVEVERHKKGGFHKLFIDFGLSNAERYYGVVLKYQLESLKQKNTSYIQGIMASGDHSSSMLNTSMLSNFVFDLNRMDYSNGRKLTVPFRAIEVGNHDEIRDRKQQLRQKYGSGKVLGYFVFAHANEKYLALSKDPRYTNEILTAADMINLDLFGKNWGEHVANPTIILDACSTGVEIAREISAHFGARVFAPLVPSHIEWINVSKDTKPKIGSVKYADPSVVYDKGKLIATL